MIDTRCHIEPPDSTGLRANLIGEVLEAGDFDGSPFFVFSDGPGDATRWQLGSTHRVHRR
jgi:hypothetical protein